MFGNQWEYHASRSENSASMSFVLVRQKSSKSYIILHLLDMRSDSDLKGKRKVVLNTTLTHQFSYLLSISSVGRRKWSHRFFVCQWYTGSHLMYQVYLTTNSKSIKVVIGTAFMGRCSCGTVVWFANIRK